MEEVHIFVEVDGKVKPVKKAVNGDSTTFWDDSSRLPYCLYGLILQTVDRMASLWLALFKLLTALNLFFTHAIPGQKVFPLQYLS